MINVSLHEILTTRFRAGTVITPSFTDVIPEAHRVTVRHTVTGSK